LRLLIEVLVEIDDPDAVTVRAREVYARTAAAVDVDGMTEKEALAVADLTREELREHPRRVTPEEAVPDGAAAALLFIEFALGEAGIQLDSSNTEIVEKTRELHPVRVLRHAGPGSQRRRTPRSPRGRRPR